MSILLVSLRQQRRKSLEDKGWMKKQMPCCNGKDRGLNTFNKLSANPTVGGHLWVLDADIKGCFDNLAHEPILQMIGSTPRGDLIKEWMKAGYVYKGVHNPTETGTPQGGVISPLLSNIGLHGLEQAVKTWCPKLGIIRYADDFIITGKTREQIEAIIPRVKQWLSERGLELSEEKTRIVNIAGRS